MTAPELKPCPFCGGDELGHTGKKTLAIVCIGCGTTGAHADGSHERSATWDAAYGLWNTRTATIPDPMQDPRVVALVEALRFADNVFRDLGWHAKWEVTSSALDTITKEPPHER